MGNWLNQAYRAIKSLQFSDAHEKLPPKAEVGQWVIPSGVVAVMEEKEKRRAVLQAGVERLEKALAAKGWTLTSPSRRSTFIQHSAAFNDSDACRVGSVAWFSRQRR